jgi:hypothetical protein
MGFNRGNRSNDGVKEQRVMAATLKKKRPTITPMRARVILNDGDKAIIETSNGHVACVRRGDEAWLPYLHFFRDEFLQEFVPGVSFWGATDGEEFRFDPETAARLEAQAVCAVR